MKQMLKGKNSIYYNVCYKIVCFAVILTFMFTAAACGERNNNGNVSLNTQQQTNYDPNNPPRDEELTEKLLKEKEIEDGQVYLRQDVAVATMVIKEGVSESKVKKLANDYAKKLKKKYKNMKVRVQAVRNGENLADVKLD